MKRKQIVNNMAVSSGSSLCPGSVLVSRAEIGEAGRGGPVRQPIDDTCATSGLLGPATLMRDIEHDYEAALIARVEQVMNVPEERRRLMVVATQFAQEICGSSGLRDPLVLADLAIGLAFNRLYLSEVSAVLKGQWGIRWHVDPGCERIRRDQGMPDRRLPVASRNLKRLVHETARFAAAAFPANNIVDPYAALPVTPAWACDPLRPPVQAVRAGANIINRVVRDKRFDVMALDLGVTVGAQALATFCPSATVYSCSTLLPRTQQPAMPSSFDAVVLGVPDAVSMNFVSTVRSLDRPLCRGDVGWFSARPRNELDCRSREMIPKAMTAVRPGGVLVVIGDIESRSVPIVDVAISGSGAFSRIPVGGNIKPVAFRYAERPLDMYGSLPPTGRLVSAWRRNW